MWTAALGNSVVDLRGVSALDREAMHSEKPPFRCRNCGGAAHLRWHRLDDTDDVQGGIYLRCFADGRGPFLTFAHNPGAAAACPSAARHEESLEHHSLKAALATIPASKGWSAEVEVASGDCRADVVISHDVYGTRVLEAQISPLGTDEALRRTELYRRRFGKVCWVHTKPRLWRRQVPSLQVDDVTQSEVVGGVYTDNTGEEVAAPQPLSDVLLRALQPDPDLYWIFYEGTDGRGFGYWAPRPTVPTGRVPSRQLRTTKRRTSARGASVKETCGRSAPASLAMVLLMRAFPGSELIDDEGSDT